MSEFIVKFGTIQVDLSPNLVHKGNVIEDSIQPDDSMVQNCPCSTFDAWCIWKNPACQTKIIGMVSTYVGLAIAGGSCETPSAG